MFYIISIFAIVIVAVIDIFFSIKLKKTTTKQNIVWVSICIILALLFFVALLIFEDKVNATNYLTGYFTELSLSIDNVFIFYIIIQKYKIPKQFQREVLTFGIIIAFVARVIFIFLGIGLLNKFEWVSYILAIMLFYSGIHILSTKNDDNVKEGKIVQFFKKRFRTTNEFNEKGGFFIVKNNKKFLTPIFLVVFFIGSIDIMFAIDSIPAALGITTNLFIVIMVNFFALFGLRQIYFLIQSAIKSIKSIHYALSVILCFIGVKIVLESLSENHFSFINGGKPVDIISISPIQTFIFIICCLLFFVCVDFIKKLLEAKESKKN